MKKYFLMIADLSVLTGILIAVYEKSITVADFWIVVCLFMIAVALQEQR